MSTHTVSQGECFTQIAERYGFRELVTTDELPADLSLDPPE